MQVNNAEVKLLIHYNCIRVYVGPGADNDYLAVLDRNAFPCARYPYVATFFDAEDLSGYSTDPAPPAGFQRVTSVDALPEAALDEIRDFINLTEVAACEV